MKILILAIISICTSASGSKDKKTDKRGFVENDFGYGLDTGYHQTNQQPEQIFYAPQEYQTHDNNAPVEAYYQQETVGITQPHDIYNQDQQINTGAYEYGNVRPVAPVYVKTLEPVAKAAVVGKEIVNPVYAPQAYAVPYAQAASPIYAPVQQVPVIARSYAVPVQQSVKTAYPQQVVRTAYQPVIKPAHPFDKTSILTTILKAALTKSLAKPVLPTVVRTAYPNQVVKTAYQTPVVKTAYLTPAVKSVAAVPVYKAAAPAQISYPRALQNVQYDNSYPSEPQAVAYGNYQNEVMYGDYDQYYH